MHKCILILGSNFGEKNKILKSALEAITGKIGEIVRKSSCYQSEPWGFTSSDNFINIVIELKTQKTPEEILMSIHEIEAGLGRMRDNRGGYQSRTIDIDILFFDDEIIDEKNLKIPHPRLHLRSFTLIPLAEIAPDFIHPVFAKSIRELLVSCDDDSVVQLISNF